MGPCDEWEHTQNFVLGPSYSVVSLELTNHSSNSNLKFCVEYVLPHQDMHTQADRSTLSVHCAGQVTNHFFISHAHIQCRCHKSLTIWRHANERQKLKEVGIRGRGRSRLMSNELRVVRSRDYYCCRTKATPRLNKLPWQRAGYNRSKYHGLPSTTPSGNVWADLAPTYTYVFMKSGVVSFCWLATSTIFQPFLSKAINEIFLILFLITS